MLIFFKRIAFFLLITNQLLLQSNAFGQEPFIRKMSFLEGLPSETIFDLFVNDKGLLFLATDKGMYSYNGMAFKAYPFKSSLGTSVHNIQQTANGTIWCKNFSNQIFYLEDKQLRPFEGLDTALSNSENLIDYLALENAVWVLTEKKLFAIHSHGNVQKILELDELNPNSAFFSITINPKSKKIYAASEDAIYEISSDFQIKIHQSQKGQKELSIYKDELFYNIKGSKNEVWSLNGSRFLNGTQNQNSIYYSLSSTSNGLWLNSTDGLYPLNVKNFEIKAPLLKGKRINKVVEDLEGNLWASSLGEGLFFIPNVEIKKVELSLPGSQERIKINRLAQVTGGNLYAGTSYGKVISLNRDGVQLKTYFSNNDSEIEFIYPYKDQIITSAGVFEKGKPQLITEVYLGKQIVADNQDNFLMATYNQAGVLSTSLNGRPNLNVNSTPLNYSPIFIKNRNTELLTFRNKRARSVYFCEKTSQYYIGFSDGLYAYSLDGSYKEIKTKNNIPIIANFITVSENQRLWVASNQNGLFEIDNDTIINHFTVNEGLSGSQLFTLQSTGDYLWILTDTGIDRLNLQTQTISKSSANLGLKGITVNDFIVDDQKIWLATNEGLIYSPLDIMDRQLSPFFEFGVYLQDGTALKENTSLTHNNNSISVLFETVFYKTLGDYHYEYLISPYHSTWKKLPSSQSSIDFLSLSAGKYTFQARVVSDGGSTPTKTFGFSIKKPYWQQWWFVLLSSLLLMMLLVMVYKWAAHKTKKKQEIKEQLALSQLTALRSQMNPHFMFNVLNAIQGLIYSNQKNKANEYIGTFSELMRKTLDFSGKKENSIAEEIKSIKLYIALEEARFDEKEFNYTLEIPDNLNLEQFNIPSLIIQPFVENAIKHGLMHKRGSKNLLLKLNRFNDTYWIFVIEDNGIGRKASEVINSKLKKHLSFASKAISSRIDLINKLEERHIKLIIEDLKSAEGNPLGTRVTLHLPVKTV